MILCIYYRYIKIDISDGDTASGNAVMSDEGIREIHQRLKTRAAYVGTDGEFYASTAVDTVNLVLHNMTA